MFKLREITSSLGVVAVMAAGAFSSTHAAEIIWVVQEEGPAGEEFIEMLRTEGHDVEVMVVAGEPPTTAQQDTMNAADLVVVSRKVNSGDGAYNTFVWNDAITTPLISHTPYILRSDDTERWQWLDGTGLADATPSPVEANEPTHKIFEGIPLDDGISPPWHFAIDRNTSVSTDGLAGGGTAIATKTDGPGDSIIVAEWEEGQVAVGPRMMFMAGSRELAENMGIGADYGKFNLTEIGQIAFLNSISHYAGPWGAAHLWAATEKDLGSVDSGPDGQEIRVLVKNLGLDMPVNITNVTFTGLGAEFYSVESFPESIAPTEVAEIVVTLNTQGNTGAFDADMVIENDSTMESLRQRTVSFSARAFNFAGPAAHYTLDETEGETINDITGFDHHATATGDVVLDTPSLFGGDGTAATFSGGQFSADLADLDVVTDFSVSLWVNGDPGVDDLQTLVARDGGGSPEFALLLSGENLQWFVNDQSAFETLDGPIEPSTTYHIVAVYEKSNDETLTLYVDGVEIARESGLDPYEPFAASPFLVGSFHGTFSYFGSIDDVQYYDRVLMADEVAEMFADPPSVPPFGDVIPEPEPEPGIVWVDWVESDAGQEFRTLLEAQGHTVTRMTGVGNPDAEQLELLNAADLVIVSRKVDSGQLNNGTWDEITAPLMLMSAYLSRANRWGWLEGDELVDITPEMIVAEVPEHPVFEGIEIAEGTTAGWHVAIDRGTSTPTDPIANGGTVIASGDGNIIVAEWPAGTVAAGRRLLFLAGSREADGNAIDTAGQYDLTATGEAAFINAINYLVPSVVVPSGVLDISKTAAGVLLTLPEGTFDIEHSSDLSSWTTIASGISDNYEDTEAARVDAGLGFYRGTAD